MLPSKEELRKQANRASAAASRKRRLDEMDRLKKTNKEMTEKVLECYGCFGKVERVFSCGHAVCANCHKEITRKCNSRCGICKKSMVVWFPLYYS